MLTVEAVGAGCALGQECTSSVLSVGAWWAWIGNMGTRRIAVVRVRTWTVVTGRANSSSLSDNSGLNSCCTAKAEIARVT